ncbi:MAG: ATP-binding protein [Bradymonadales bacterium]|nr:ATP-binding protein [Bradymonadales bacterium]
MALTSHDITPLAKYAREVVRDYLALQGDEEEEHRMWKGFRVSGKLIANQFRLSSSSGHPPELQAARSRRELLLRSWVSAPPENLYGFAELTALFELNLEDLELFIMAAAPAIDPEIEELFAFARNDVQRRWVDIGFICQALALGDRERYDQLFRRCSFGAPLRRHRLITLEKRRTVEDPLDQNLATRQVRAADRVLEFLRSHRLGATASVDESLASICVRLTEHVPLEDLALPDHSAQSVIQIARSRRLPLILQGPEEGGLQQTAQALAGMLLKGLLRADLTPLLNEEAETLEVRLAEIVREARLGGDLVYLYGENLPGELPGPKLLALSRALTSEALVLGVSGLPMWAVGLTSGWPIIPVPLPDVEARLSMWEEAFKEERQKPSNQSLVVISRRYQMSHSQIRQAAVEARRLAQIGHHRTLDVVDLDRACRAHFAHQLGDLAALVPPTTLTQEDLILPEAEKEKFREVLLYAREQEAIYSEWGFAEKFPYGRGLSMLFHGPPGTGKTMAAMIIAGALGLDLFRVDLSRILSRWVGETEKNLARVFDEAERGRVMLLFDEADSMFTRRTDVQTSVDRYANLEVAYLLQRMENFEGITVLTTNIEQLLDEAFKRRIRYRIYFPMPDEKLRGELWKNMLPKTAPVRPAIPYQLLGKHFEVAGGHIKQAVLRSAVYARRDGTPIGFKQLLEAAQAECRELGMLVSDRLPKELAKALEKERDGSTMAAAPSA